MYKISLVDMPFADLWFPSLALTQLKSVLEERLGEQVRVRVLYLNQDVAQYFGLRLYGYVSGALETNMAALGDWLFRQIAFPQVDDNVEDYFQRCFPAQDAETLAKKQAILRKRKGLASLLDRLVAKYGLADEDLVGFTSMFCQNVASFALARRIKDHNPAVITAMGGANCEAPMGPELVRSVEQIDYVFSGPGLISFPKFVATCLAGRPAHDGIRGVFSKPGLAQPDCDWNALGEERPIDQSVPLDYGPFLETLAANFDPSEVSPVLLFETSRGCWWGEKAHCTFCGLNGGTMAYRAMSPDKALAQFQDLFHYAPRCNAFTAVDNILPKSYLRDVLPRVDTPDGVEIFYEVKADLSEADLRTLARARVTRIQPGVESLATSTLRLMRKGTTALQNLTLLKHCARYGIHPEWNLLIGFPGEREDVFRRYVDTLRHLVHLPPPGDAFHVRFDRYSPYFVQAAHYGLDLHPSDFYAFIYPFGPAALRNLAYYFTDHNYGAAYIAAVSAWSARVREQVAYWRARAQDRRSTRPRLEWAADGRPDVVFDSRAGAGIEHELSATGGRLLRALSGARALRDLATAFPDVDLTTELGSLVRVGLVFEEDERYLSLVLDEHEVGQRPSLAASQAAAPSSPSELGFVVS